MFKEMRKAFASVADALAALPPQESGTAEKIQTAIADCRAACTANDPGAAPSPAPMTSGDQPLLSDHIKSLIRQHVAAAVAPAAKKRAAPKKKAAAKKKKR